MKIYISILRGINVGGNRRIKMDALKQLCVRLGFVQVQTYIQSGNIIFQSILIDEIEISEVLKNAIEQEFGFDVPVITLSKIGLQNIIQANPYSKDTTKNSDFFHVTFLAEIPKSEALELLKSVIPKNEIFEVVQNAIYLYCPNGYSNSKLMNTFIENKLQISATTRNWKTVNELYKISCS
jgi:uncharacterized protein (DUF1697 family)